jgi:hypothetical protein
MGAGGGLELLNEVGLSLDFVEQFGALDEGEAVGGLDEVDGEGAAFAPQLPLNAHFYYKAPASITHLTPPAQCHRSPPI